LVWLDAVAGDGAIVPAVWPFEINNVLLAAQRRKRISESDILRVRTLLDRLPLLSFDQALCKAAKGSGIRASL
jgi:hypothetical protein